MSGLARGSYLCYLPALQAMKFKSYLAKPFASVIQRKLQKSSQTALEDQQIIMKSLLSEGAKAEFGKEHHFGEIIDYKGYTQAVPILSLIHI